MAELMVLLQALLLVAGWLLFLRAQAELRAQVARQSLTGEMETLQQTLDALLTRLIQENDRAEQLLQLLSAQIAFEPPTAGAPTETPTQTRSDSGYNLYRQESPVLSAIVQLAQEGLSPAEIARQTGYALGEVELILNLNRRYMEEDR